MRKNGELKIKEIIAGKKILFVTTKNLDYLRNQQEIKLIKSHAEELTVIGSYNNSYFFRLLNVYLRFFFLNKSKYHIVFAGFLPQLILPLFFLFFRRKTIIIDFFVSLYDTLVFDRMKFSKNSFFAGLIKYIDMKTLAEADYVISDTKAHGDYFVEELGCERNKIIVFYLEADRAIYYPREVEKNKEFKDKYVVLYFGSILPLQGVNIVLEAIESLKDNKDIYFLFIGPVEEKILDKYKSLNNVYFISWLKQEDLAESIAMADLCLAGHFNNNIGKAKRVIPGKAYIYNLMNKPVILGDNIANRELFSEDNDNIFFVEMGSSVKLREKILFVYDRKKRTS